MANQDPLGSFRRRLLDLTRRNSLLNYKHPRQRSLRIVDELPDQLFTDLYDGTVFTLTPVPEPPRFQDASGDIVHMYPERAGQRQRPDVAAWARHKGIDTDYELPSTASEEDARHRDRKIQTLFYPEELEAQLGNIARLARTAMEESGVNILYLAFGFLEWRDKEGADPSLAPLVLLPVTITRKDIDPRTRRYKYEIQFSEEDMEANISLREMLTLDFGMDLPPLEEEDTPESYLTKCGTLLVSQPSWKLHRNVTLGFFQFGKLLMYLDLDPANWPEGRGIEDHPIIRRMLDGDVTGEVGDAPLHPVDELKPADPEFQLIQEADSSQHSAIVDAASGKDLVIEGPPGTGKSQTITNIIAVALNQGKSVLFVAEKLAALKVVKDRLDKAGLGMFCLELHSNRANKKLFYEDLRQRRAFRVDATRQATLATKVGELQRTRQALNSYAELVGRRVDGLDISYSDLFGRSTALRDAVPRDLLKVDMLKCDASLPLDSGWLATADSRISRAETVRADIVRAHGSVDAHPWSWLAPKARPGEPSPPADETELWLSALQDLKSASAPISACGIDPGALTTRALSEVAAMQAALPQPSGLPLGPLARLLANGDEVAWLKAQAAREAALDASHAKVTECYDAAHAADPAWFPSVVRAMKAIHDAPIRMGTGTVAAALEVRDAILAYLAAQPDVTAAIADVQRQFPAKVASGLDVVRTCAAILSACRQPPLDELDSRFPGLEQVTDLKAVEALGNEMKALGMDRDRAALAFHVAATDNLGLLSAAADVLQRGGMLGFLDGEWRSANAVYKQACRAPSWFKPSRRKGQELAGLVALRGRLAEFESNAKHTALLGKGFRGMATPVAHYLVLIRWFEAVKAGVGQHGGHTAVSLTLAGLPREKLQSLQSMAASGQLAVLERALTTLAELQKCLSAPDVQRVVGDPAAGTAPASAWIDGVSSGLDAFAGGMRRTDHPMGVVAEMLSRHGLLATDPERIHGREALGLGQDAASPLEGARKAAMDGLAGWASTLWAAPAGETLRRHYAEAIRRNDVPAAHASLERLGPASEKEAGACAALHGKFHIFRGPTDPEGAGREVTVEEAIRRVSSGLSDHDGWGGWITYTDAIHSVCELDAHLAPAARAYHRGEIGAAQLAACAQFLLFNTHARMLTREHPAFRDFSTHTHETLRTRFAQLDGQVCQLHRELIASRLTARKPPKGRPGPRVKDMTEMSLLDQQMSLQRPRMSMRQVMAKAAGALQVLKPCFMMGPLSVAQFLRPGNAHFDLIVMDEASQMRPEDALGAVARGTQLIVVGDPKQLPPTTFFDKLNEEEGPAEEGNAAGGQESILQMATPLFAPTRLLQWHYRSKHESLIAFSNRHFYKDRLLLFPTSMPRSEDLGVHYRYVEHGAFKAGVNEREAAEAVRGAMREIRRTGGSQTVAIVAMNVQQAAAIREEWDKQLRQMDDLRAIVEKMDGRDEEPFDIKNLENVQGDERDIIVISMTYGPDMDGNFFQRFGPINQEDGWRRLNVLFTRARRKMVVYSSMLSSQVVPGAQSAGGPAALRGFLEYCERGRLVDAPVQTARPPANEFEEQVIALVQEAGFGAEPQVGVAGYFVDIGVTHPAAPGRYVLGIECDGAPYHSSRCARDRDKLREQVLVGMGWDIHRIWSPDWFSRTSPERQRLKDALARIRETMPEVPTIVVDRRELSRDPDSLRDKLHGMRRTMEQANPDVPAPRRLLRNEMLDLLVRHRPTSSDEFRVHIPEAMRTQTDPAEAAGHLETVLSIIDDHG